MNGPANALTYRLCPCCGADRGRKIDTYSPDIWVLVACAECDFVYLQNPPPYEALIDEFAWEKTHALRSERRKALPLSRLNRRLRAALGLQSRHKADKFRRVFGQGRVLDIGCADSGRICAPLVPFGIEISATLQQAADAQMRAAGGYCLHGAGADRIRDFDDMFFDGILMHSYLEHEVAVADVLTECRRVLKPNGKIFVRVPNYASLNRRVAQADWCGFRYPDHVNYFTPASLRHIAAKFGFKTKFVNPATLPVNDNVQALLSKI